jgi:hypothetical protein
VTAASAACRPARKRLSYTRSDDGPAGILVDVRPRRIPIWRQLLLGLLGYPSHGDLPKRGWLRWAMIGTYGLIAVVLALIVIALIFA